ncbi:MAG TPA: flagellar hook-basal body complex protein FliE [Armatimonadota bacterium]|nr:flagellar hook-basal body complex protein FliE [Armatimonadota bacterium]
MNITPLQPVANATPSAAQGPADPVHSRTFGQMLRDAVQAVDDAQNEADEQATKLVTGEAENLHDVIIATEEAGIMLSLAQQVRNRAVEAYQEIMRTQI